MSTCRPPRVRPGPWGVVAVLLAALPAFAGPIAYGANRWWIAGGLAALSFLGLALWVMARPRQLGPWCRPAGFSALAVWTAWLALLGLLHAPVPHASLLGWLHAASCLSAGLVLADVTRHSKKAWSAIALSLPLLLVVEAGYIIVQHFQESPYVLFASKVQYGLRDSGTYVCPNHSANLLAMGGCAALGLVALRRNGFSGRLFAGLALLLTPPALLFTESRSGIVSALVALWATLVLIAAAKSRRHFALAFLGIPLAGFFCVTVFAFAMKEDRIFARFSPDFIQNDMRLRWWWDVVDMIRDRPVQGWGAGTFQDVAARYKSHYWEAYHTLNSAHNEGLQIAAEQGLAGLAVAGVCVLLCLAASARLFLRARGRGVSPLAAGWIGCLLAAGLQSLLDFNLRIFANNHVLVLISSLAAASAAIPGGETAPTAAPGPRRAWWRLGAALPVLAAMVLACQTWAGSLYQLRAQVLLSTRVQDLPGARQALIKGRTIDPLNSFFPIQLALLHAQRGEWLKDPMERKQAADEAEQWLIQAEGLHPYAFDLHQARVEILRVRGDDEKALDAAWRMTKLYPAVVPCFLQVGDMLVELGRLEEAREAYTQGTQAAKGNFHEPFDRLHELDLLRKKASKQKNAP
jgi:O-antigen ligase